MADDFLDITTPLKQLSDAAFSPLGKKSSLLIIFFSIGVFLSVKWMILHITGTPGREANFEDKARNFDNHAAQLSTTARMAARAGKSTNKDTIEGIQDMSNQVCSLI